MDLTAILLGAGAQLVTAGALGGVGRWLFLLLVDKRLAPTQGIATVLLGALLGYYVSPFLAPVAGLALEAFQADPAKLPGFTAFTTGAGGVAVFGLLMDFLKFRGGNSTTAGGVTPMPPQPGDSK